MTVIRKWSGDNADGLDSTFQTFPPEITYEADATARTPHLLVGAGTGNRFLAYNPLGNLTAHAGRMYVTFAGFITNVVVGPLNQAGDTAYRILVKSNGTWQINDSNNAYATATYTAMTVGVTYRVEWSATLTSLTLKIYVGDSLTLFDTCTNTTKPYFAVDNMRVGWINNATNPAFTIDDLVINDTGTLIGPASNPPPKSSPRVAVIGDSLTNMAPSALSVEGEGAELVAGALESRGYEGQNVYFWGVGGKKLVPPDLTGRGTVSNWADAVTMLGTIDRVIVALGTNDRPNPDATINADLDTVLSAVGPSIPLVWIGLTSKTGPSTDDTRVNNLIQAKLAARGNAVFADWSAFIHNGRDESGLWQSVDSTHMTHDGYQIRADFYAAQLPVAGQASGTATGATSYTGSAVGRRITAGIAAGVFTWAGLASGMAPTIPPAEGAATGQTTRTGTASGTTTRNGAAEGTTNWTGAATGQTVASGTASGSTARSGLASGVRISVGTVTGQTSWTGAATGTAPVVGGKSGTATGTTVWNGAAAGATANAGTAAGTTQWTGTAVGTISTAGTATGNTGWAGAAEGAAPTINEATGTAEGHTQWVGVVGTPVERDIIITGLTEPVLAWTATDPGNTWSPAGPTCAWGATESTLAWTPADPTTSAWTTGLLASTLKTTEPATRFTTTEPTK